MGIRTIIIDDHDGAELPGGTRPLDVSINDVAYRTGVYLSAENQAKLDRLVSGFLGAPTIAEELDAILDEAEAAAPGRPRPPHAIEKHGFTPAEARAYCRRNGIPIGDRGRVPQSAYDALKASEDEGCETAEQVRARLEAEASGPALSTTRVRRSRATGHGSSTPKTYARTREENREADETAAQLMRLLDAGGDFEVVAEGEPNDRMAQAINHAKGNFTGMRGFEAVSRTAHPAVEGPYGRPLVNILARRLP